MDIYWVLDVKAYLRVIPYDQETHSHSIEASPSTRRFETRVIRLSRMWLLSAALM
jgi:hypothetical protein